MLYRVYAVRDVKTGYAPPFVDQNDDSALRGFAFAFANQSNMMSFCPEDFSLYCIGEFDSLSGELKNWLPQYVGCASDFAKRGVQLEE